MRSTRRHAAPFFVTAMILALPSVARSQAGFEGTVTFVMRDKPDSKPDTIVQIVKGRSVRMDTRGGGRGGDRSSIIMDGEKKRMIMIDDKEKSAMIMTQDQQEQMKAMAGGLGAAAVESRKRPPAAKPAADDDIGSIVKTGRSETVAGVRCEVYKATLRAKTKMSDGEMCIADGVGFALFNAMANNPMFQTARPSGWTEFQKIAGNGKGLVKATATENGKTYVALEMIKAERRSVPASTFDPPAGYQVQDMSALMGKAAGAIEQLQKMKKGKPPI